MGSIRTPETGDDVGLDEPLPLAVVRALADSPSEKKSIIYLPPGI